MQYFHQFVPRRLGSPVSTHLQKVWPGILLLVCLLNTRQASKHLFWLQIVSFLDFQFSNQENETSPEYFTLSTDFVNLSSGYFTLLSDYFNLSSDYFTVS